MGLEQPAQVRQLIGPFRVETHGGKQLFELPPCRSNDLADEAGACAGLALPLLVKLQRRTVLHDDTAPAVPVGGSPIRRQTSLFTRHGFSSAVGGNRDASEALKALRVGGDDSPIRCSCGGGDDEVVCTARSTGTLSLSQQFGVGDGHFGVVGQYRDGVEHGVGESPSAILVSLRREVDADEQFCCGDRSDGHCVVVADEPVE